MEELISAGLGTGALGPGMLLGVLAFVVLRFGLGCLFVVDQNERAVKTRFGRAVRLSAATTLDSPLGDDLEPEQQRRYQFPVLRVYPPGGPYFRWPWEKVLKVSVATQTLNMAYDPESPSANSGGTQLEAVTKDQLNTGLSGELRYRVSDQNLYAYFFGVKQPIVHVMGYFISVLRERIASFEAPRPDGAPADAGSVQGVSINDLRKNLRELNEFMDRECASSTARYGITLEASLITGIDPPSEVESALAAINTAHNHASSEISLAQAAADQKIVQSRRAVEIETLNAHAEVEPLVALAAELTELKKASGGALPAYLRYVRMPLVGRAAQAFVEDKR